MNPVSLVPDDLCVACWHPGHPPKACPGGLEPTPTGEEWFPCLCEETVTNADRGKIIVEVSDDTNRS